jgi:hypothetical protein
MAILQMPSQRMEELTGVQWIARVALFCGLQMVAARAVMLYNAML